MTLKPWLAAVCCAVLLVPGCAWLPSSPSTPEVEPPLSGPTATSGRPDAADPTQSGRADPGRETASANIPASGSATADEAGGTDATAPLLSSATASGPSTDIVAEANATTPQPVEPAEPSSNPSAEPTSPVPPVSTEDARLAASLVRDAKSLWTGENCADPDRALAMLDAALELHPDEPEALLWRGRTLAEQGYLADAFDDLTLSIRLRPTAMAYAVRGLTGMRLGNMAGARQDLDHALALDGAELHALLYRSAWFFLHEETRRGCSDLQAACRNGLCGPLEDAKADKLCY